MINRDEIKRTLKKQNLGNIPTNVLKEDIGTTVDRI